MFPHKVRSARDVTSTTARVLRQRSIKEVRFIVNLHSNTSLCSSSIQTSQICSRNSPSLWPLCSSPLLPPSPPLAAAALPRPRSPPDLPAMLQQRRLLHQHGGLRCCRTPRARLTGLDVPVGLSCSPITVIGNNCGSTTVNCDAPENEWGGLIAINCLPITL
ncbi:hypothetical protein C8R47DRAFT_172497 [Mycena vitilis]|nr:hypothetical protein C8R47DRAFT_172497 [Mycena vitilis]